MAIELPGLIDEGAGPPLLLLHGFPDTSELWRELIVRLRQDFHCIAPTLPGFGADAHNQNPDYSAAGKIAFIENVLATLKIEQPVYLVVFDHGGPYGLHWALAHPEKVAGIVVINTLFHASYRWHFWARLWRTPGIGELSMKLLSWPLFQFSVKLGSPNMPTTLMRPAYEALTPEFRRNALALYRATNPELFVGEDERLQLLTAKVPTLVLWGERDPYIERRFAQQFGARRVRMFPKAGHWLVLEEPDAVAEEIRGILKL